MMPRIVRAMAESDEMTETKLLPAQDAGIAAAAALLRDGELVAFPTETVYGLGADATNDRAVAAVYEAKGRPQFNPLIVHVDGIAMARQIAEFDDRAEAVAGVFWPGPLTLILPRREDCPVSRLVSAGLPTVAVRMPDHEVARKLIAAAGVPLAAPSANRSGRLSPTTPMHVMETLQGRIAAVMTAGKCRVGVESTVLDLSSENPAVLRYGAVTAEELEPLIGPVTVNTEQQGDDKPRSPGQLLRHYAPQTPLRMKAVDLADNEALLAFGATRFMSLQSGGGVDARDEARVLNLSPTGDLTEAAANLFAMLYRLDAAGFDSIAVMDIPETGLGLAINDRLRRACAAQAAPE